MKHYVCKEYECDVPDKHCLVCKNCTDVFYDYTNGPYMFICNKGWGGEWQKCEGFEYDGTEVVEK